VASDAINRIAASIHKAKKGTLFGHPRGEVVKHPGSFKKYAERHKESTHAAAEKEKHASGTLGHRARLALAFETMRKKKKEG
jgi:hypothetical protein